MNSEYKSALFLSIKIGYLSSFQKQAANSLVTETLQYFVFFCRSVCSAILAKCLIINVLRLIRTILFFIAFLNITYISRHTWATIAQNDCGANMYEVAFGMNHSHGFNITRGYVKIDFTPAWELNAKIIDFIFFSNKNSKQSLVRNFESPAEKMFRITKKMMIYGRAYFKGEVIAEVTDIGFDTVDDVISALANQLPNDIPIGCNVQFRLTNCDSQKEAVYVRSKGKGF